MLSINAFNEQGGTSVTPQYASPLPLTEVYANRSQWMKVFQQHLLNLYYQQKCIRISTVHIRHIARSAEEYSS